MKKDINVSLLAFIITFGLTYRHEVYDYTKLVYREYNTRMEPVRELLISSPTNNFPKIVKENSFICEKCGARHIFEHKI